MYMAAVITWINNLHYGGLSSNQQKLQPKISMMAGLKNIRIFTGSFDETLPAILNFDENPGLVFIDGNHRKEPVIEIFQIKLLKFLIVKQL